MVKRVRRAIVAVIALAIPSIVGAAQDRSGATKPQSDKPPTEFSQKDRSLAFLRAVSEAVGNGRKHEASEFEPPGKPPGRPPDPPGHNDPPNPPGKPPDRPPENSNGNPHNQ